MKELKKALTFDDILLVPAHSEVLPKQVSLTSKLQIKLPCKPQLFLLQWIQ